LSENIILAHIHKLFIGYNVERTSLIRMTRNADIDIHEEEVNGAFVARAAVGRTRSN
jgi:polyphosphate kinase